MASCYALWERQNWKAHEIDFSVDKEHWLATPARGAGGPDLARCEPVRDRREQRDRRPGAVPGRRPDRRDRGPPGHPARRRGPPRGVLRPFRRRGARRSSADDLRGRMHELGERCSRPGATSSTRAARRRRRIERGRTTRPVRRAVATYHLVIEGYAGDDRAAVRPRVPRGPRRSTRASSADSSWSSATTTATSRSAFASSDALEQRPGARTVVEHRVGELVPRAAGGLVGARGPRSGVASRGVRPLQARGAR